MVVDSPPVEVRPAPKAVLKSKLLRSIRKVFISQALRTIHLNFLGEIEMYLFFNSVMQQEIKLCSYYTPVASMSWD